MKIKTTVISPVGTFESNVSEEITQEEYDATEKFCQQANKMSYFSIGKGGDRMIFPDQLISNSVIMLSIIEK